MVHPTLYYTQAWLINPTVPSHTTVPWSEMGLNCISHMPHIGMANPSVPWNVMWIVIPFKVFTTILLYLVYID